MFDIKLNKIGRASWLRDFNAVVDELRREPDLAAVVIRGEGRAFCTGIDLTALAASEIGDAFFRDWEETLRKLESLAPTVIAAVHSYCVGGGLQLALACDLRIARDDARLGVTAVKEGIVPGMGMWRIARHAGLGRAKWLGLTAEVIDAPQALAWGLVDYVASAQAFDATIDTLVNRSLEMARTSTQLTKRLANLSFDLPYSEFLEMFCECQRIATRSPEHEKAMAERRVMRGKRRAARGPAVAAADAPTRTTPAARRRQHS